MDEQGIPQVTNAELIAYHEAILLELRNRLDNYLDLGADDLIAADEGFNFAGQLQATLAEAVEHTASIRERLVEDALQCGCDEPCVVIRSDNERNQWLLVVRLRHEST